MNKAKFLKSLEELKNETIRPRKEFPLLSAQNWGFQIRFLEWDWSMIDRGKGNFYDLVYDYINNFENNEPNGLWLYSKGSGWGKTVVSTLIFKELLMLRRIRHAKFLDSASFSFLIREGSESYDGLFFDIDNFDLMVFDDLGREYSTPWLTNLMFSMTNRRYGAKKPIIATSNFSIDEYTSKMKDQDGSNDCLTIRRRLFDMCVEVNLADYLNTKGGEI